MIYDPYNELQLAITDQDHQPNMLLIKTAGKSYHLKRLIQAYEHGYLRFEDMRKEPSYGDYVRIKRSLTGILYNVLQFPKMC